MTSTRLYGRNPRGGGGLHYSQTGRAVTGTPPSAIPLPQSPPRMLPGAPRTLPPQVGPVPLPRTQAGMSGAGPWRGGDNTNDALIVRDRHGYLHAGYEIAGRTSSMADPPASGPARPSFRVLNRTVNWQAGTGTAYTDDLSRPYTHVGEQGSGWTSVYGGAPGFYRQGPGGVPVGDPGQGPARVWAGPPHGLHTMYPPDRQQTLTNYRARPQMVPARVDRLSNSRVGGQTYSQWTQHQGGRR